jgi:hypothetical protein
VNTHDLVLDALGDHTRRAILERLRDGHDPLRSQGGESVRLTRSVGGEMTHMAGRDADRLLLPRSADGDEP